MKLKALKRLAAAAFALAIVGTSLHTDIGSTGLFSGSAITANAEGQEQSVTIDLTKGTQSANGQYTYSNSPVSITADDIDSYGIVLTNEKKTIIVVNPDWVITRVEFTEGWYSIEGLIASIGTVSANKEDSTATVNDVYNPWVTVSAASIIQFKTAKVYYERKSTNITGVMLNKTETTLSVGSTEQLNARVIQETAADKTVVWSSDNAGVVTVDQNGNVKAVAPGTATITVIATNGTQTTDDDKTAICTITVLTPIPYLDWDAASRTVVEKNGDNACKFYNVIESTDGELDLNSGWYIVNDNVTINGLVRIKGDVHLILCDGAKLTVNNTANINPDNPESNPFAIEVKENCSLTVYGQSEGDNAGLLNPKCDSTETKGYVTYATGEAISLFVNSSMTINSGRVTAEANCYGIWAYGTLTINGGDVTFHSGRKGIVLGKSNATYNYQCGNLTINGGRTTAYSDKLDSAINVLFNGENESEVYFADNMFFTGKDYRENDSEKVLRIPYPISNYYYWVRIEPITDVTEITLNKTETTLTVGGTQTLEATIEPINSDGTVTWKSSNEAVATVDQNGVVSAVGEGTVTITATATNGTETTDDDKEATCAVTVEADKNVISSTNITLGGELGLNFYLTIPDETAGSLKAVMNGPEGETEAELTQYGEYYRVSYPVKAIHADKSVTLTLIDSDGEAVDLYNASGERFTDNEFTYSIYDYVRSAMALDERYVTNEQKAQIRAMYTYAAYSVKWKYGTELPTDYVDTLPEITADDLAAYKLTATGTENVDIQGASLLLDSNTAFKLYFKCDTVPEITLNGKKATPVKSGNMYYIAVTNIGAKHLKDKFTVVFGGEYTVEFTALSYAYGVLSSTDERIINDTKLNELVKAICAYSDKFAASANN